MRRRRAGSRPRVRPSCVDDAFAWLTLPAQASPLCFCCVERVSQEWLTEQLVIHLNI